MGITTALVTASEVREPVRAVASVVPDEGKLSHVHSRVAGWVERLYVNTTGEQVKAGQAVAGVFSQELLASQIEFLSALKAARVGPSTAVTDAARTRLKVLGMSDTEVAELERRGTPRRLVTVVAPQSGVVLQRGVTQGTAIDPSTELVTIANLTTVWVIAEVPEGPSSSIKIGEEATLEFPGSGLSPFPARVEFVYPTLSNQTRTVRVRFAVKNPGGALKPGSFGTAKFAPPARRALTVPRDAVVDTGEQQLVFVATGQGTFEPRAVHLGVRWSDGVEIQHGVQAGEQIVTSGVFLIDSESRLRASGGGTGHQHGGGAGSEERGSGGSEVERGHDAHGAQPARGGADHSQHGG